MENIYVNYRNHFKVKRGIVGTLVESSEKLDKEKHKVRTSVCVCDLKMSHIGEPHQLVSVYIRVE